MPAHLKEEQCTEMARRCCVGGNNPFLLGSQVGLPPKGRLVDVSSDISMLVAPKDVALPAGSIVRKQSEQINSMRNVLSASCLSSISLLTTASLLLDQSVTLVVVPVVVILIVTAVQRSSSHVTNLGRFGNQFPPPSC